MTIVKKHWNVFPKQADFLNQFPKELGKERRLAAQVLYNRGLTTVDIVEDFLAGTWDDNDPFLLKGMDNAVTRLSQALDRHESMVVYGDYDVDGITSTTLLVQYLRSLGARVQPYIPNRFDEGYGLNNDALKNLAEEGANLIVTVDCGIRAIKEAKYAAELGLDMIITDHHGPGDEIPPARAVINPKQPDCPYPFKQLAGVGLAFKLAQAIHQKIQPANAAAPDTYLDLVALGTVADLASLTGENRKLVKLGLAQLNQNLRPGLAALLAVAGAENKTITAETIGFGLGPRLNAAGRLESAQAALELLMAGDEVQARPLAQKLHELNRERQQKTRDIVELARQEILADETEQLLYLISHPDFESGVVGLAASRLAEEFYRPMLVAQPKDDGTAVGSARSIAEFHITRALDQCEELLVKHGGHSAAAGFTVNQEDVPLLRTRLQQIAADMLNPAQLYPTIDIDAELNVDVLHHIATDSYLAELEQLEPFGMDNPRPLFVTRHLIVKDKRAIGHDGSHLRLVLKNDYQTWNAIGFGLGHWADKLGLNQPVDIVYSLEYNEWNNTRTLQLNLKDIRVQPAIIVHGGAWRIPAEEHDAHQNGCRRAAQAGFDILAGGGTALDAVEAAVTLLEDDPTFDAGIGSHLNQAGVVQLDAGLMDGDTLQVGAVAAVERIRNPIQLARRVLTSEHNMFVGPGAEAWAEQIGYPLTDPHELVVAREQQRFEHHRQAGPPSLETAFQRPDGTVGAVAIDRWGNLAAATSTGGTLFKPAGRVGDSPLPGCGYFADNQAAAVSSTGHGESIIRVQLARTAADLARTQATNGPASPLNFAPAEAAIDILANRVDGRGGLIMIDRTGRIGFAHNTPNLARAWMTPGMAEPEVGI